MTSTPEQVSRHDRYMRGLPHMSYQITIKTAAGSKTYTGIGDRNSLMDAAYAIPGVMGVSAMVRQ